jgi:RNA polymerase sigma-70 factor (ECF subfamily)
MQQEDGMAIALARDGDGDAFRALVERHSRTIFRLAYRMTGNEHDAEDIVQETFLRAYRGLRHFESRANFSTWLHRIAVNCSLDLVRGRQRQEPARDRQPAENETHELASRLADPGPTQERVVFSVEVQRKVEEVLGQLSPKEKAAFVMRHFQGMSIEEISRIMGLRANAAKNNIFRAVRKLRQELEPLLRPAVRL